MMAAPIDELWSRYRNKGLLVDSNLLLVYFIGIFDRDLVARFERTRAFLPEDFLLLGRFITSFSKRVTTPNVLTEVSNLSGKLPENIRNLYFASLSEQMTEFEESYVASSSLARTAEFPKFGLTDASIMDVARNKYLVLTDDFPLSNFLRSQGQDVVNFNHLRQIAWRI